MGEGGKLFLLYSGKLAEIWSNFRNNFGNWTMISCILAILKKLAKISQIEVQFNYNY